MSPDKPSGFAPQPTPVERIRGSRPEDEAWRADALGGSRHSRWIDELRSPLDLQDRGRAEEICGQVSRMVLQDFAPALLLLERLDRLRLQAITAYSLTLFDFARQSGLEGERLTAINRWQFDLETALDGRPPGQPVFVMVSALAEQAPWTRSGFDALHACARRRCVVRRPPDRRTAEADALALGKSLAWLVLAEEPTDPVAEMASALVRLRGLSDLGEDLRRHRARLPIAEIPDSWSATATADLRVVRSAVEQECERLSPMLGDRAWRSQLPISLQPAARYCQRTARRLLDRVRAAPLDALDSPPRMGLLTRLGMLLRSRWL